MFFKQSQRRSALGDPLGVSPGSIGPGYPTLGTLVPYGKQAPASASLFASGSRTQSASAVPINASLRKLCYEKLGHTLQALDAVSDLASALHGSPHFQKHIRCILAQYSSSTVLCYLAIWGSFVFGNS